MGPDMHEYERPKKKQVIKALDSLIGIQRPIGDNEGLHINSPAVFNALTDDQRGKVLKVEKLVKAYTRKPGDFGDAPNKRSLTELRKSSRSPNLYNDPENPYILSGSVKINDELSLDIGDLPPIEEE